MSNDSYIAVTCHYVDIQNEELKSVLLSCFLSTERHTSENLANDLRDVLEEWNVIEKVVAIVSDNAANIVNAVTLMRIKHIPCFAHSLNLGVQTGLRAIDDLHSKTKTIVAHFKRSTVAANKLAATQKQKSVPVLKLKQSMPTRWNSSLFMFQRILEVRFVYIFCLRIIS